MTRPLSGIVLAGGSSRRMGVDKASLTFGDRPLLEIVIEAVSAVCGEVIVAGGPRKLAGTLPAPVRFVRDRFRRQGPLAGLHAGLAAARGFALVVACDMPFLNPRLLAHMASLRHRYQAVVPRVDGRWHPTHAVYARSALPIIEEMLARGDNSMEALLGRIKVRELSETELRRHDPEGLSLLNLNSPEDMERARAIWGQRRQSDRRGDHELLPATP